LVLAFSKRLTIKIWSSVPATLKALPIGVLLYKILDWHGLMLLQNEPKFNKIFKKPWIECRFGAILGKK
jgi:predicted NAD/FAD-binding protein